MIFNFDQLLQRFAGTEEYLQKRAVVAVNRSVTLRSWCFGIFIVEYEQNGEDRAQYGKRLLESLSTSLKGRGMKGISVTALKLCRQFYLTYPEIGQTLSDQLVVYPKTYRRQLKRFESELVTNCHGLKSASADCKKRPREGTIYPPFGLIDRSNDNGFLIKKWFINGSLGTRHKPDKHDKKGATMGPKGPSIYSIEKK